MYIGGRGDGSRNRGDIKIPEQYSGNALARTDTTEETSREYKTDNEALKRAEEAFRRGYVFEDAGETADDASTKPHEASDGVHMPDEEASSHTESDHSISASVSVGKRSILSGSGGLLSGILGGITLEHVILISLILILFDSKADDELLIMLAILFIC